MSLALDTASMLTIIIPHVLDEITRSRLSTRPRNTRLTAASLGRGVVLGREDRRHSS